MFSKN